MLAGECEKAEAVAGPENCRIEKYSPYQTMMAIPETQIQSRRAKQKYRKRKSRPCLPPLARKATQMVASDKTKYNSEYRTVVGVAPELRRAGLPKAVCPIVATERYTGAASGETVCERSAEARPPGVA